MDGAIIRPALVFVATTMAAGVVVTFLPLAVTGAAAGIAAPALLMQSATATLSRWLAGRHGDRHGPARLIVPALLMSVAGILLLALIGQPVGIMAGAAVFGAGFGVAQNATLALMYARVSPSRYGVVSAIWNTAYDAGIGLGAVGFGALAGGTGYPLAFVVTGGLMLLGLRVVRPAAGTSIR